MSTQFPGLPDFPVHGRARRKARTIFTLSGEEITFRGR
jgi:hypothetical protein